MSEVVAVEHVNAFVLVEADCDADELAAVNEQRIFPTVIIWLQGIKASIYYLESALQQVPYMSDSQSAYREA